MVAYYNEFDPGAAAWLRELIAEGLIAPGVVDERSILDVQPDDLRGFTQCHFFAGIGGWSRALRLASWPDTRPVWTGSPPCQPFSAAGKGLSRDDPRHLAPCFIRLVRTGGPRVLFGEQVASADVFGKAPKRAGKGAPVAPQWAWFDDLSDRLEAAHYAVGASDIPAAGVGGPHLRQRTVFVAERLADADDAGLEGQRRHGDDRREPGRVGAQSAGSRGVGGATGGVADADGGHPSAERQQCGGQQRQQSEDGGAGRLDDTAGPRHLRALEDAEGHPRNEARLRMSGARHGQDRSERPGPVNGFWRDPDWLFCRDGKWRPTEPGIFPLAHGVSGRVGLLRGAGNAIVPQVAAAFIEAWLETERLRLMSDFTADVGQQGVFG